MKKVMKSLLCAGLALTMFGCGMAVSQNNKVEEKVEDVQKEADFKSFAGNYQDEVSQRASMTISEEGKIQVTWASSATETTVWEMSVQKDGDKLVYSDCKKSTNDQVEYENGKGYFEIKDGKLSWSGAQEENCQTCQFVKM